MDRKGTDLITDVEINKVVPDVTEGTKDEFTRYIKERPTFNIDDLTNLLDELLNK
jgi:hypothetical protein